MSRVPGKRREGLIVMSPQPHAGDGGNRLYRALVETSTDVIALIGIDGRIRFINHACRDVLGFEPEEMMGGHVRDFNANRELPGADVAFERIIGGESRPGACAHGAPPPAPPPPPPPPPPPRRKDGTNVELMFNASPLRDDEGR